MPSSMARGVPAARRFAVRDPFDDTADRRGRRLRRRADRSRRSTPRRARSRPGARARRPSAASCCASSRERMLADEAALAELCTRENGKPLKESVAEVRYAASFLDVVRRRGRADVRRDDPGEPRRPAPDRDPRAGRAVRADHAVELSVRDADPQARRRARGRLHGRREARRGRRRSARSRSREIAERVGLPAGVFNVVPRADGARAGGRLLGVARDPQDQLHRLDRGRHA